MCPPLCVISVSPMLFAGVGVSPSDFPRDCPYIENKLVELPVHLSALLSAKIVPLLSSLSSNTSVYIQTTEQEFFLPPYHTEGIPYIYIYLLEFLQL